ALREDDLERVARANVLLRLDDVPLVLVPRRQSPRRAGAATGTCTRIGLCAAQEVRDLGRVAAKHLRHPQAVVETDERRGDAETALREAAAVSGKLHRRLERGRGVVTQIADHGPSAPRRLPE